jgi:hypothetical protein
MPSDHEQQAEKSASQTGELHVYQTSVNQPAGRTTEDDRKPYSKTNTEAVGDPKREKVNTI